ncbi:hypothetical protein A3765_16015 [Oleiphilus sp. HI0130]|nr:hypothetical protein A3765_16015 [Oleiphilus sp. HI0130]
MIKRLIRELSVPLLLSSPFDSLSARFSENYVPIFMLHRFACPALGIEGHQESFLRFALSELKRYGYNFVSVEDVVISNIRGQRLPRKSVAFSLDDGYWDQAIVGGRVFEEYDCPATFFVTTGFLDGDLWLWDAKVSYMVENSTSIGLDALRKRYSKLSLVGSPATVASTLNFYIATFLSHRIDQEILEISKVTQVDLPVPAPEKYKAMSWSQARYLERLGMKLAPHSLSHPILSSLSHLQAQSEIIGSWNRLNRQVSNASPVFCYPTGRQEDFGSREAEILRESDLRAAVSAMPGYVGSESSNDIWSLPRFSFPENISTLLQYASWIEHFKSHFRRSTSKLTSI